MSSTHERALIEACLKGDQRAHKQLYDKYVRTMFGICLRYCSHYDEAKDVLKYLTDIRREKQKARRLKKLTDNTQTSIAEKPSLSQLMQKISQKLANSHSTTPASTGTNNEKNSVLYELTDLPCLRVEIFGPFAGSLFVSLNKIQLRQMLGADPFVASLYSTEYLQHFNQVLIENRSKVTQSHVSSEMIEHLKNQLSYSLTSDHSSSTPVVPLPAQATTVPLSTQNGTETTKAQVLKTEAMEAKMTDV